MASTPSPSSLVLEHHPKRPRVEGEEGALPVIVKSTDLWLPDGNIFLRTISTPPTSPILQYTLYKVHKGILALHSSVFRDLFDGPQTAFDVGSEVYEELPVMDMPDSPDDVAHFLKALYFPECDFSSFPYKATLPDGYAGILRLATKYDVQNLRTTTVAALRLVWPSRLADWDVLQDSITTDENFPKDIAEGSAVDVSRLYEDPAKAIRLAIDCDVPEVLPIAYYDLMRIHVRNGRCGSGLLRTSDTSVLTAEEIKKLLVGMGNLQEHTATNFLPLPGKLHEPSTGLSICANLSEGPVCGDRIRLHWVKQLRTMNSSFGDILLWMLMLANGLEIMQPKAACRPCTDKLKDVRLSAREHVWSRLPKYFYLVTVSSIRPYCLYIRH
ncbi:hypothetical protein OF83DRAFT_1073131 [Amylostereum chailletii]|nr:hypothetical protein OF83DRAFT_1073131 [Amylostereum chailletii]